MVAVIRSGGKQYRVSEGASVRVEKLPGQVGESVTLDDVLLVGEGEAVKIGTPTVDGARVTGTIVAQGRGERTADPRRTVRPPARSAPGAPARPAGTCDAGDQSSAARHRRARPSARR